MGVNSKRRQKTGVQNGAKYKAVARSKIRFSNAAKNAMLKTQQK